MVGEWRFPVRVHPRSPLTFTISARDKKSKIPGITWLVVECIEPSLGKMMDFVSWDDDIPNI
jgi:hypothetical protein